MLLWLRKKAGSIFESLFITENIVDFRPESLNSPGSNGSRSWHRSRRPF